jgi:hypothetical protein
MGLGGDRRSGAGSTNATMRNRSDRQETPSAAYIRAHWKYSDTRNELSVQLGADFFKWPFS